eukprot:gene5120-919_t
MPGPAPQGQPPQGRLGRPARAAAGLGGPRAAGRDGGRAYVGDSRPRVGGSAACPPCAQISKMAADLQTLTPNLVLQKTKVDHLGAVRNLNLWSQARHTAHTLERPPHPLDPMGNELENLSLLREMPNVEILSLSVNKIHRLSDFAHCPKLAELYLRKNAVADLFQVAHLRPLPLLRTLWLCDNPVADHPLYRRYVLHCLPQLKSLDNAEISDSERAAVRLTAEEVRSIEGARSASGPPSTPSRGALQEVGQPVQASAVLKEMQEAASKQPRGARAGGVEAPAPRPQSRQQIKPALGPTPEPYAKAHSAADLRPRSAPRQPRLEKDQNVLAAITLLLGELSGESLADLQQE